MLHLFGGGDVGSILNFLYSVFRYISNCYFTVVKKRISTGGCFFFVQNDEETNLYRFIEFLCIYICSLVLTLNIIN